MPTRIASRPSPAPRRHFNLSGVVRNLASTIANGIDAISFVIERDGKSPVPCQAIGDAASAFLLQFHAGSAVRLYGYIDNLDPGRPVFSVLWSGQALAQTIGQTAARPSPKRPVAPISH